MPQWQLMPQCYVNPKNSAHGDNKRPCDSPNKKNSWATHTILADFGVFRFQWVQGSRHYLHMRMQQVCPGHGCFRPDQQPSGGFDHRKCLLIAGP